MNLLEFVIDLVVRTYELLSVNLGTKEFVGYFLLVLSVLGFVGFAFGVFLGLPLLTLGTLVVVSTAALCGAGAAVLLTKAFRQK